MITKFEDWNTETQKFVKNSVYHVVKNGFVYDINLLKKVEEDSIYCLIDIYKANESEDMDIDSIVDIFENKMPELNYIQQYAINMAVWYLHHHQLD